MHDADILPTKVKHVSAVVGGSDPSSGIPEDEPLDHTDQFKCLTKSSFITVLAKGTSVLRDIQQCLRACSSSGIVWVETMASPPAAGDVAIPSRIGLFECPVFCAACCADTQTEL